MTLVRTHPREAEVLVTAADAMRPFGPQVHDDMTVEVALSVLVSSRAGHLLLCDEDGRCAGMVTKDQLMAARSRSSYTDRTRLRAIAYDHGPFTSSVTPVRVAERAMRDRQLGASPVVDTDGYALGVLALLP
ncbi:CBS domain-containing protein [Streptomyces sp. NBC_00390]|uniref:CBS domain-containing protein n=1 Tax=Streptomyces sp. NBC_00390 TaxID=2975736 RepID=UPI002E2078A8